MEGRIENCKLKNGYWLLGGDSGIFGKGEEDIFQWPGFAAFTAKFFAAADSDEASLVHNADAVGHFFRDAQLVCRQQDRHAGAGSFLEQIFDNTRVLWVEADHGFVDNEDFRIV